MRRLLRSPAVAFAKEKCIDDGHSTRSLLTVTEFYRVHAACPITDNARKTDATLTLSGRRFVYIRFHGIVMQERHLLSHLLYGIIVRVVMVVIICT